MSMCIYHPGAPAVTDYGPPLCASCARGEWSPAPTRPGNVAQAVAPAPEVSRVCVYPSAGGGSLWDAHSDDGGAYLVTLDAAGLLDWRGRGVLIIDGRTGMVWGGQR